MSAFPIATLRLISACGLQLRTYSTHAECCHVLHLNGRQERNYTLTVNENGNGMPSDSLYSGSANALLQNLRPIGSGEGTEWKLPPGIN